MADRRLRPSRVPRPVVLLILDGFGARPDAPDNAITRARMPHWNALLARHAHGTIDASEMHVGLPDGQMGNSEVGHLNIGAGRVVYQDLTRIDHAIATGEFGQPGAARGARRARARAAGTVHLLGLLSPGGVHSHEKHLARDGRDSPADAGVGARPRARVPRRSRHAAEERGGVDRRSWTATCASARRARASPRVTGRYYAMDRDKRWERVEPAYDALVARRAASPRVRARRRRSRPPTRAARPTSSCKPTVLDRRGRAATMSDGDVVVFLNFRADRARQITRALTDPAFDGFARSRVPALAAFVCLTRYGDEFAGCRSPSARSRSTTASARGSRARDRRSLRIAETEKYAHVTFFFNGGTRGGLSRARSASSCRRRRSRPTTCKPEMSAPEVTDKLVAAIEARQVRRDRRATTPTATWSATPASSTRR